MPAVQCTQWLDGVLAGPDYEIPTLAGENQRAVITRKFQAALNAGWTIVAHTATTLEIEKVYPPNAWYQVKHRLFRIV